MKHLCRVLVGTATLGYGALILALCVANALGAERFWWSTVNLYLPQVFWALPAPFLVFALWLCRPARRWLVLLPLLLALWVLGPLMSHSNLVPPLALSPQGTPLRVMTYNIERGSRTIPNLLQTIAQEKPDLFLVQDNSGRFEAALRQAYPTWHVERTAELLVATRLPLHSVEAIDLPRQKALDWKACLYTRCVVEVGTTEVAVFNLHFITPRYALEGIRHQVKEQLHERRFPRLDVENMEGNAQTRLEQARIVAARIAQEPGPVIVVGDFNAPMSSLVCRTFQGLGLREAFQVAGRGYGFTYGHTWYVGKSFVRIDHVFASPHFGVQGCHIGASAVSDHRPVIADLLLP